MGRRSEEPRFSDEGPHQGKGPREYRRSDSLMREDFCERLTDAPFIDASEIGVEVRESEGALAGGVASRGLCQWTEDLAELVYGVAYVQNNLSVRSKT